MKRRTTIEIDDALLDRAKVALGCETTRATVEEALRRVADHADENGERRARVQREYLERLGLLADLEVLGEDDMWR